MRAAYLASRVLPDADSAIRDGAVVVEGERIAWVGASRDLPAVDERLDLGNAVLLPGLVNAHSHLDLTHLKGSVPFEGEFARWAEKIMHGRKKPGMAEAARKGIREALARGTTTFGDIVDRRSFGEIVEAFRETGARGRLFVEAIGFRPEQADEVFDAVWDLVEMRALPANVATGISPHAPYSVSRPLLERAVAVADGHGRPLAVHLAETLEELAFLRHGIGPLRELLKRAGADDPSYVPDGSATAFVKRLDLARAPLLLVHGNYLRPRDVPAGAFVVYCPTAHAFFKHPEHPVLELLEEGVRVALGSDSAASGDTVDLLSETRHLAAARPDVAPKAVFRMATEWGARALGFEAGTLRAGSLADLAAFTPALGHEVLGNPETRCVLTVVGGRIVHRVDPAAPLGETAGLPTVA
ncbi:MAG TPA: amidohydrolase family protein [Planctomycetota bacterium]|nr:amidohydrolase family protein [Planctomycetota bacterium]